MLPALLFSAAKTVVMHEAAISFQGIAASGINGPALIAPMMSATTNPPHNLGGCQFAPTLRCISHLTKMNATFTVQGSV